MLRFFAALVFALGGFFAGIVGESLVFDWPWYVNLSIALSLLTLGVVLSSVEWWRSRLTRRTAKDHDLATLADRWEAAQQDRWHADELRNFWDSLEGQLVRHNRAMIDASVRIVPHDDTPYDPLATGTLRFAIDDSRMAVVHLDLTPRSPTWRDRVVHAAIWPLTVLWLPHRARPLPVRVYHWVHRRLGVIRLRRRTSASAPPESLPPARPPDTI